MKRKNTRSSWLEGLLMAEDIYKTEGLPGLAEWYRDAGVGDYYFCYNYDLYRGFKAYCHHMGLRP
jgi:hypothetical protein